MARSAASPTSAHISLAVLPSVRERWDSLAVEAGQTRTGFLKLAVELADCLMHTSYLTEERQREIIALLVSGSNESAAARSKRRRSKAGDSNAKKSNPHTKKEVAQD
jgi:hypothetical protein